MMKSEDRIIQAAELNYKVARLLFQATILLCINAVFLGIAIFFQYWRAMK